MRKNGTVCTHRWTDVEGWRIEEYTVTYIARPLLKCTGKLAAAEIESLYGRKARYKKGNSPAAEIESLGTLGRCREGLYTKGRPVAGHKSWKTNQDHLCPQSENPLWIGNHSADPSTTPDTGLGTVHLPDPRRSGRSRTVPAR